MTHTAYTFYHQKGMVIDMDMNMEWTAYVRPELLVLAPALYLLGVFLKKSPLNDRWIPVLLCAAGCVLSFLRFWGEGAEACGGWQNLLFTSVTQGILGAACSVYAKNLYKQFSEKGCDDEET